MVIKVKKRFSLFGFILLCLVIWWVDPLIIDVDDQTSSGFVAMRQIDPKHGSELLFQTPFSDFTHTQKIAKMIDGLYFAVPEALSRGRKYSCEEISVYFKEYSFSVDDRGFITIEGTEYIRCFGDGKELFQNLKDFIEKEPPNGGSFSLYF